MNLKDLGVYKANVQSVILQSTEICELLIGETYNKENVDELILYKYFYPYLYVDSTQTEEKAFICMEVTVPRVIDFSYKDMKIIIWCCSHKGIMNYSKPDFLGTRVDILADMIDRKLNTSNKFGIGRLKLDSSNYIYPANNNYYGRELVYKCVEFNTNKKL